MGFSLEEDDEEETSMGAILESVFRLIVILFEVDFSVIPPLSSVIVTVIPLLKNVGGMTNQKTVAVSAEDETFTGDWQRSVTVSVAELASSTVGVPPTVALTIAFPASFSPLLPFTVIDETETLLPYT